MLEVHLSPAADFVNLRPYSEALTSRIAISTRPSPLHASDAPPPSGSDQSFPDGFGPPSTGLCLCLPASDDKIDPESGCSLRAFNKALDRG
jgi:hypothetical protein